MRKTFLLALIVSCLLSLTMAAQTDYTNKDGESYFPKPYAFGAVSLMPGGYGAVAGRAQVGLYTNSPHYVSDCYIARDNGKKTNDGTENNIQGHDNYAACYIGPKFGNTFVVGGARWSQLITTNYTKGTNLFQALRQGDYRWTFGAGHDWLRSNFSMRGQAMYILPPMHESVAYPSSGNTPSFVCQGCGNGLQGPEFTIWMPSPDNGRPGIWGHLAFRESLGIYEFHTTITEPCPGPLCNPPDFYAQDHSRHVTATADIGVQYTFFTGGWNKGKSAKKSKERPKTPYAAN